MIPNKLDKFVSNTTSELNIERPSPVSTHSRFFKLAGKFNSHDSSSRSKATPLPLPSPNRSTSSSIISNPDFPPPGPAHYAARRALWLTPTKVPRRSPPSSSRQRLEHLLSEQGAVSNEAAWKNGIEKVWKGLVNGGRLKRSLPLSLVIKVIHAGWLRDPDTWPAGAVAPDSDQDPVPDQHGLSFPVDMLPSNITSPNTTSQGVVPEVKNETNPSGLVIAAL
ncbi:hypothetical protein K503DRAFT_678541 [Rhizopogon vinicolor AM-OR11-026]|uniref:Uncharacterized protein n=1 Tax=Rhizopogon vinicolor AM-OR11-026 TaxID=1314800 RepID=A0A1B7NIA4_9AGAM|nr:hypothetical protein K503DRAFT_678541 [Rhizopogon vinicolor AM-OR11-026]